MSLALIISVSAELIIPWKWVSTQYPEWFFEKQGDSDRWVDRYKGRERYNYTQISVSTDSDGYPLVSLQLVDKIFFLNITRTMVFSSTNPKNITREYSFGIWAEKTGKRFNLTKRTRPNNF